MQKVGFDRMIEIEWLNKTVEIYNKESDIKIIKQELNDYLKDKVISDDNRKKCVNILTSTWVSMPDEFSNLRDKAIKLYNDANENERLLINWSMMMLAFPIFCDIIDTIGKLLYLQDDFAIKTVLNRIYDKWGERSTVKYAVPRIIYSMVQWKAIEKKKPGICQKANLIAIDNIDIELFFIECYMRSFKKDYINFYEVNKLNPSFPFRLSIRTIDILNSDSLNLYKANNNLLITFA
ncbi:hypothetical protein [Thermoanaerobacterium thermosaccharolyticum]|uniref:Uncharacterized protein n=1 Tax=Thermoanaerobacterium thermosaccharolyticum M0795 TaxID=698948 RepID=L0IKX3_THETR|nr:hypothetical protein [Thermoanaerobacterium thermosaccharolyticum]AGB19493.1 hypothetical protein Thethe_01882 [Thermoanaerobacterium thermosaccharolyticum M0795]